MEPLAQISRALCSRSFPLESFFAFIFRLVSCTFTSVMRFWTNLSLPTLKITYIQTETIQSFLTRGFGRQYVRGGMPPVLARSWQISPFEALVFSQKWSVLSAAGKNFFFSSVCSQIMNLLIFLVSPSCFDFIIIASLSFGAGRSVILDIPWIFLPIPHGLIFSSFI